MSLIPCINCDKSIPNGQMYWVGESIGPFCQECHSNLVQYINRDARNLMLRIDASSDWTYVDFRGDIWRLTPTNDPHMPLIINLSRRLR